MRKQICRFGWISLCVCTFCLLSVGNEAQGAAKRSSVPDTVRLLEQSTFGPTSELIAHVQEVGFKAFLDEQLAAPLIEYPELEFWPQSRPATCIGMCQRD